MGLEACQVVVVVDLDRGVLGPAVCPLGLAVGPGMVGLGQAVLDAVVDTAATEDVATRSAVTVVVAMLGQVGERYPIVGEHGVDRVEEGLDHVPEGGSRVFWRKATTMASSTGRAGVSTVLFGAFGPIGASAIVVRLRHLCTVLGFRP